MKTIVYAVVIVLLAGCTAGKNVKAINKDILQEEQQLLELGKKINVLDYQRFAKTAAGQLDETTDSITKVYIQRLKDSVNTRLNYFKAVSSNLKSKKNRKEVPGYLTAVKQRYGKELDNILFLDDLFQANTFNRLNTAAYFGPGEYQLSDAASEQASVIMQKILKDAFDFSAKHADRRLKAMFIVLGYADEQDISKGSAVYNELIAAIGTDVPDRKHLNAELSNKRASCIKNILKNKYQQMVPADTDFLFSSSFIATGKGEALPSGDYKDYKPGDERRRVVLLYWSILPDLN